ncbi:hypothetical protein [Chitinophaga niabensis]|uniref:Uncharacterized protein n=1 Tax=Chitinophaga niabensis TaxID=536979 RepID=A0A1N6IXB8_9BACT|nr:hypothetical protein [Chitinophaga niabensis]SIO36605.1 hypothetical protein SAMN04488055_3426 [Chitinophaga niabensis]
MPSFTDTELQMKFCEGFTFFPFKSLEQHGTLIYKSYAGDDNLKKVLEWSSKEHSLSQYITKISKKIKRQDLPAASELLQTLNDAGDWWEAHPLSRNNSLLAKKLQEYHSLTNIYHQKTLLPTIAKLTDKHRSISVKGIMQMEEDMQQFVQDTDTLLNFLKDQTGKKSSYAPRMLDAEDREYLSKMASAIEAFRALQERNVYLLDAWKTHQMIHNSRRAMN